MSKNEEVVREDSLPIHEDGRVTIPHPIREEYGLVERQLLTVRLLHDGETEQFQNPLGAYGRLRIPRRIMEATGVEPGDLVDLELVF